MEVQHNDGGGDGGHGGGDGSRGNAGEGGGAGGGGDGGGVHELRDHARSLSYPQPPPQQLGISPASHSLRPCATHS